MAQAVYNYPVTAEELEGIMSQPQSQDTGFPVTADELEGLMSGQGQEILSGQRPLVPVSQEGPEGFEELPSRAGIMGTFESTGAAALGSAKDLAEMTLRALRSIDAPGQKIDMPWLAYATPWGVPIDALTKNDTIRKFATPAIDWLQKVERDNPEWFAPSKEDKSSFMRKSLYGGVRASAPSAMGMLAVAGLGPAGAILPFFMYGGAETDRYLEEAKKQGKSWDESIGYALASGLIEGGGEAVSDLIAGKLFGFGGMAKSWLKSISKPLKDRLKYTIAQGIKAFLKQYPVEAGTELGQAYSQEGIKRLQGLQAGKVDPLEIMGTTAVLTGLFSSASQYGNKKYYDSLRNALENENTPIEERISAIEAVSDMLGKTNKSEQKLWDKLAYEKVEKGEKIDLSGNVEDIAKQEPGYGELEEVEAPEEPIDLTNIIENEEDRATLITELQGLMKGLEEAPVEKKPVEEAKKPIPKPENPLILKTKDGKVYKSVTARLHSDMIEEFGLKDEDVVDKGFFVDGKQKWEGKEGVAVEKDIKKEVVHSINITDSMKKSVIEKGQPQYAVAKAITGIKIDPNSLSKEILSSMNNSLKAMGYDVRGSEDIKNLMLTRGLINKDGVLWQPDWIKAYEKATGAVRKRQKILKKKADYKNVNWQRIKELGTTSDIREAGYISPSGAYIDLSGKKEGGMPGTRSYDHREAGGTKGMQEIMAYGYIRMGFTYGLIDIAKEPTSKQYDRIGQLADRKNGEIQIELTEGLGEYDKGYDFYFRSSRNFYREYPVGTKGNRIVNDVKRFYAGKEPIAMPNAPQYQIGAKRGPTPKIRIEPTPKTKSDRIRSLERALSKDLDRPITPGTLTEVGATTPQRGATKKAAKAFGIDAIFFKTKDPGLNLIEGATMPWKKRAVYINANSSRPVMVIAGHELTHSLRNNYPDLHDFLRKSILDNTVDMHAFIKQRMADEKLAGLPEEKGIEYLDELIGDFAGEQFANKDFWTKLEGKSPTLTRRLIKVVQDILDKIKTALTGAKVSDRYIADIDKAQTVLADVMEEFSRRQLKKEVQAKREADPYKVFEFAQELPAQYQVKKGKELDQFKDTIEGAELAEGLMPETGEGMPMSVEEFMEELMNKPKNDKTSYAIRPTENEHLKKTKEILGKTKGGPIPKNTESAISKASKIKVAKKPKESSAYEIHKDDWFKEKDWAVHKHSIEAGLLQDGIKHALGLKRYNKEAQDIDAAMHIYLDLKRNPSHYKKYWNDLTTEQKRIVSLAKKVNKNSKLRKIANYIESQYKKLGEMALSEEVINNVIDNYVGRAWKFENKPSAESLRRFGTTTRHSKHRVFETILEGQAKGYELAVVGATNNLALIQDEIVRTIEDKRLIKKLMKEKWMDTDLPMIADTKLNDDYKKIDHPNFKAWKFATKVDLNEENIDDVTKLKIGDFVRPKDRENIGKIVAINDNTVDVHFINKKTGLEATKSFSKNMIKTKEVLKKIQPKGVNFVILDDGTILEKRELYAPKQIANNLNKIIGKSAISGKMRFSIGEKEYSAVDIITKYNAVLKSTLLMTGFFHHQAFIRSYLFGTRKKTAHEWRPIKAYKEGKKAIKEFKPEIELLVRNGLTLGKMQDWEESILRQEQTIFGKILDKGEYSKAFKNWAENMRQRQADFLFRNFGAGLKASAALIEYRNAIKKHPEMSPDEQAKMVAELINDDFGGLHLGRMGRSPTGQHFFRLLALAPDWTESNVRTMYKAFISGDKAKRGLYKRFWISVLTKGLISTTIANLLLSAGDDDDYWTRLKKAWEEGNLKWLDVDVTPLYRAIYKIVGAEPTDARKYFSILGHFKDPLKFILHPIRSAHHKGSVISRMAHELRTGMDWRGQGFTSFWEFLGIDDKGIYVTTRKGKYKAGEPKGGKMRLKLTDWRAKTGPVSPTRLPSYLLHQFRSMTPIQIQNFISWVTGEQEGFDAILKGMGVYTSTTYPNIKKAYNRFVKEYVESNEEKSKLLKLKEKVLKYNKDAKERGEQIISLKSIGVRGKRELYFKKNLSKKTNKPLTLRQFQLER